MRVIFRSLIALTLIWSVNLYAQGNSWKDVRYNGGTLQTKVAPKDWGNHLTVTSDLITFQLKDGQKLEIPTKSVTGLSYGQEAHRRVGTMVALGILVAPVALFGLFHKTRLHFIGIEYTKDGQRGGLLLQGHKDNYRAILMALKSATGAPLAVSEKDREFAPTGVQSTVVKKGNQTPVENATQKETGKLSISSEPNGAEVYVDGQFSGNTPCKLPVDAGKHAINVSLKNYKDWTRELNVGSGSEMNLNAVLEK
jgi:hypothetical protein